MLYNVYFSAKGTTERCALKIAEAMGLEAKSINWLRMPAREELEIGAADVLLFSMPVYGGFIPKHCADMAKYLKGHGGAAIITAVYGNRHYDDALLEMKDILMAQGFKVMAAGAFVAEHSIFPKVAAGRPDEHDLEVISEFGGRCRKLLERITAETGSKDSSQSSAESAEFIAEAIASLPELSLPGNKDYKAEFGGVPFKPEGDESCIGCRTCASVCPMGAIDKAEPKRTDRELCISCGACIKACPTGSRNYYGPAYKTAAFGFEMKCSKRREPEVFFIKEV
ncbi:MAG TPA: EFR1 family ferrodoxin [Candidatus Avilachnospira avistercoris]|nr:EFR1 family ferrodoxin [Candidatus Avilachnospira avistercoris]